MADLRELVSEHEPCSTDVELGVAHAPVVHHDRGNRRARSEGLGVPGDRFGSSGDRQVRSYLSPADRKRMIDRRHQGRSCGIESEVGIELPLDVYVVNLQIGHGHSFRERESTLDTGAETIGEFPVGHHRGDR